MQQPDKLKAPFDILTTAYVDRLSPKDAEKVAIHLLADSARMKEHGTILSWSEFNENPDPLVNQLLAKIIVGQFDRSRFQPQDADAVAVLSIENSAAYLALEVATEVARSFHFSKPPRIIRARKLPHGESPSPAMSQRKLAVQVKPITSGGEPRTLVASLPDDDMSLQQVKTIIVVDDFKATQSTLNGGIQLAINLFRQFHPEHELLIIPTAALGKPEQVKYEEMRSDRAEIWNSITALDVHFGPDPETGGAYIQANGFDKIPMRRASSADFNGHDA